MRENAGQSIEIEIDLKGCRPHMEIRTLENDSLFDCKLNA